MDSRNIRERLERVIRQYGFKLVTQNEDKLSHYYEIRHKGKLQMSVIRISNHCTSPSNWRDRYGSNNPTMSLSNKELRRYRGNYNGLPNKYFKKAFYSLVVYDPKIDGIQQCGNVQEGGISVYQNTYDATQMTNEMLAALENTIQQIAHQGAITENNTKTQYKMKQKIRLTEGDLHRIVRQCVNEAANEPIYPYHQQTMYGIKHPTDSVRGRYLRYSPEDFSFDSTSKWNQNIEYDAKKMVDLIDSAMDSLRNAREYANSMGHSNWYYLLNAILGELNNVLKREHGTGERWGGKEMGWYKPEYMEYDPTANQPWE